jgi:hypothetical protein
MNYRTMDEIRSAALSEGTAHIINSMKAVRKGDKKEAAEHMARFDAVENMLFRLGVRELIFVEAMDAARKYIRALKELEARQAEKEAAEIIYAPKPKAPPMTKNPIKVPAKFL